MTFYFYYVHISWREEFFYSDGTITLFGKSVRKKQAFFKAFFSNLTQKFTTQTSFSAEENIVQSRQLLLSHVVATYARKFVEHYL